METQDNETVVIECASQSARFVITALVLNEVKFQVSLKVHSLFLTHLVSTLSDTTLEKLLEINTYLQPNDQVSIGGALLTFSSYRFSY